MKTFRENSINPNLNRSVTYKFSWFHTIFLTQKLNKNWWCSENIYLQGLYLTLKLTKMLFRSKQKEVIGHTWNMRLECSSKRHVPPEVGLDSAQYESVTDGDTSAKPWQPRQVLQSITACYILNVLTLPSAETDFFIPLGKIILVPCRDRLLHYTWKNMLAQGQV